jgi:hypothetical protein
MMQSAFTRWCLMEKILRRLGWIGAGRRSVRSRGAGVRRQSRGPAIRLRTLK